MKRTLLLAGMLLLALGAACTPAQVSGVQTLAAVLPAREAPMGGQVAAIPTVDPDSVATVTPAPSIITFPTAAPPVNPVLATMTAVAGLVPTFDLNTTPYVIALQGHPHFVEFQARW